jgi:hypothetical protein
LVADTASGALALFAGRGTLASAFSTNSPTAVAVEKRFPVPGDLRRVGGYATITVTFSATAVAFFGYAHGRIDAFIALSNGGTSFARSDSTLYTAHAPFIGYEHSDVRTQTLSLMVEVNRARTATDETWTVSVGLIGLLTEDEDAGSAVTGTSVVPFIDFQYFW